MIVLPPIARYALRANHINRRAAAEREISEPDPAPLIKFFNPLGAQTWLATELAEDGDVLWGLADLGFGCPEMPMSPQAAMCCATYSRRIRAAGCRM